MNFQFKLPRPSSVLTLLVFSLIGVAGVGLARAQNAAEIKKARELSLFPSFKNPLTLFDPATGPGVSCPDPAVMSEVLKGVNVWYLYCTGDPLNSNDKNADGSLKNHYIATWRSIDLIHWTYDGDVFPADPAWIGVETNLWAPAIKYFNKQYYLYYVAPATTAGGPEIGVATSPHAGGPWKDLGRPVVPTEAAPCCSGTNRAVIDPRRYHRRDGPALHLLRQLLWRYLDSEALEGRPDCGQEQRGPDRGR